MKKTTRTKDGKMITTMTLSDLGSMTDEERQMIQKAKERPIVYDEDCPPIPEELLNAMLWNAQKKLAV